jgi:hypothetical protein
MVVTCHEMKKLLFLIVMSFSLNASAQLAEGATAPDFTLTDYNGNTHNLYSYLNSGKTVFVEIFAAHCPGCWAYHQTHTMKSMYNSYGPGGTDEIMVLALEHDQWNGHNAFIGDGDPWVTQGNWLEGTPFPIFNVEDPNRGVFDDYNVTFYPVVYKICPDKIVEQINTSIPAFVLYEKVEECLEALAIDEESLFGSVYINHASKSLVIDDFKLITSIKIIDYSGRIVKQVATVSSSAVNLNDLESGVYLFQFQTKTEMVAKPLYLCH